MNKVNNKKICIICEGSEEFDYLTQLKKLNVWNPIYNITLKNAKSIDNIIPIYQYMYQTSNNDLILIFCDTEIMPYTQFINVKNKLNKFHNIRDIDKSLLCFANPCTMQIILSHFDKIKLKSNQKSDNSLIIKKLTGINKYQATEEQRINLMKKINNSNYMEMKQNLHNISIDFNIKPSTNFLQFLNNLESNDISWINTINNKLLKED